MLKHYLLSVLIAAFSAVPAYSDYLFSSDFESGKMPVDILTFDNDAQTIDESDYRVGYTTDGWTVVRVLGGSYAAVSPSHSRTDVEQSNVMTLPSVRITGQRPMLRWKARSIHPYLPEAYRVLLHESGASDVSVLLAVEAEDSRWHSHAIDLSPWIGKEVAVSFECVSVNKYLLAVDDIKIGDPEEANWQAEATNGEYTGLAWNFPGSDTGVAHLTGTVTNMGIPLNAGRLLCISGGTIVDSRELPSGLACGQSAEYDFSLPVSINRSTPYQIAVENIAGNRTIVLESQVRASWFARTLLLTEYTGLWCNNCPAASIEVEDLEHRFGKQLIKLVGHIQTANNDPLECADYRAQTYAGKYFSVPRMVLNHNTATNGANCSKFADEYESETPVDIEICEYSIQGGVLKAKAAVTWATDCDNSSDRYRLGYVLTHDVVTDTPVDSYSQKNSTTSINSDRFYYLPTRIKSDLSPNPCVVAWGENSGQGWEKSLPLSLKSMKTVGADIFVELDMTADPALPASLTDLSKARLVAYVIDTNTGVVLNSCFQNLDEECVPVHKPESGDDPEPDPGPDPDPDPDPETDTATLNVYAPEYAVQGDIEVVATVRSTSESGLDNWTLSFECDGFKQTKTGTLIAGGTEQSFSFSLPLTVDRTASYSVTLTAQYMEEPLTAVGSVTGLAFMPVRRILLEHYSDTENTLATAAIYTIERMEADSELEGEILPVSVYTGQSPLAVADYDSAYDVETPCFRIDRDARTIAPQKDDCVYDPVKPGSAAYEVTRYFDIPCFANIELDAAYIKNSGLITGIDVMTNIIPARTLNGSQLAIGFILTENNVSYNTLSQINGLAGLSSVPSDNAFGQLPAEIPGMYFSDVARQFYGYSGLPGSVPSRELMPAKKVSYNTILSVPDNVLDTRNLSLTAYLLDIETGSVINAARIPLSSDAQPKITSAEMLELLSGVESVNAEGGVVEYYNLQGVRVHNPLQGIYIVRRGEKVSKEIIR